MQVLLLIHNKIYLSSYIALFLLFTLLVFYSNSAGCHAAGVGPAQCFIA